MVNRCGQLRKEALQGRLVVGVERCGALRADVLGRLRESVEIAAGDDDVGSLGPGAPSCFQPDACAAADHHDSLAQQFRFPLSRNGSGTAGHASSAGWNWKLSSTTLSPSGGWQPTLACPSFFDHGRIPQLISRRRPTPARTWHSDTASTSAWALTWLVRRLGRRSAVAALPRSARDSRSAGAQPDCAVEWLAVDLGTAVRRALSY